MDTLSAKIESFFKNDYVSSILSLILILYAGLVAPKLPPKIIMFLDNPIIKLLFFFLIIYISRKNATVAIISAIGVLVTLMTISKYKFDMELVKNYMFSSKQPQLQPDAKYPQILSEKDLDSFDVSNFDVQPALAPNFQGGVFPDQS